MNLHVTDTGIITFLFIDDDRVEQELMKAKFKTTTREDIELVCVPTVELALEVINNSPVAIILLDNRLGPVTDFRETLPQLRSARFTGPIGVVSNNIRDEQIQSFEDFGADFRIAKEEIDANTIHFLLSEYTRKLLPEKCNNDYL
jgi:CheY-like chemotaxis protein